MVNRSVYYGRVDVRVDKAQFEFKNFTIVLLSPTAPLRRDQDILKCIENFKKNNFDRVFTVSSQHTAVLKSGVVQDNSFITVAEPEFTFMNRHDLPKLFRPNGAVYLFNGEWFEKKQWICFKQYWCSGNAKGE